MHDRERECLVEELQEDVFGLLVRVTDDTKNILMKLLDLEIHLEQLCKLKR